MGSNVRSSCLHGKYFPIKPFFPFSSGACINMCKCAQECTHVCKIQKSALAFLGCYPRYFWEVVSMWPRTHGVSSADWVCLCLFSCEITIHTQVRPKDGWAPWNHSPVSHRWRENELAIALINVPLTLVLFDYHRSICLRHRRAHFHTNWASSQELVNTCEFRWRCSSRS